MEENISYPVYKGLQRPLEFMGLQGRYIAWAAVGALGALIAFAVGFIVFGFGVAIVALIATLGSCVGLIAIKQKKGLHTKKIMKGVHITNFIFSVW